MIRTLYKIEVRSAAGELVETSYDRAYSGNLRRRLLKDFYRMAKKYNSLPQWGKWTATNKAGQTISIVKSES